MYTPSPIEYPTINFSSPIYNPLLNHYHQYLISKMEQQPPHPNKILKIALVGPSGSGKTHTINLLRNDSRPTTKTIGCNHFTYIVNNPNTQQPILLSVWDCAGSKPFEKLAPAYTRNSDLVFLMYSPYEQNSLNEVKRWLHLIQSLDKPISNNQIWLVRQIRGSWLSEPSLEVKEFAEEAGLEHRDVGGEEGSVKKLFEMAAQRVDLYGSGGEMGEEVSSSMVEDGEMVKEAEGSTAVRNIGIGLVVAVMGVLAYRAFRR